jgi:hypothetical protein
MAQWRNSLALELTKQGLGQKPKSKYEVKQLEDFRRDLNDTLEERVYAISQDKEAEKEKLMN